jgi:hypothetical protein
MFDAIAFSKLAVNRYGKEGRSRNSAPPETSGFSETPPAPGATAPNRANNRPSRSHCAPG